MGKLFDSAMRLRIEYFDQNDAFAAQLPREGTVVARPTSCDSRHDWYLIHLDTPIVYNEVTHSCLLIASRWKGYPIGASEPTSVFILLVPPSTPVSDGFSHHQFEHVAWGMAHTA
jgi:hypothetical protein